MEWKITEHLDSKNTVFLIEEKVLLGLRKVKFDEETGKNEYILFIKNNGFKKVPSIDKYDLKKLIGIYLGTASLIGELIPNKCNEYYVSLYFNKSGNPTLIQKTNFLSRVMNLISFKK